MMKNTADPWNTDPWFTMLSDTLVAEYVTDAISEVYSIDAGATHFVRVIAEDDHYYRLVMLTNNRAQLIAGEATASNLPESVVASMVDAMLG